MITTTTGTLFYLAHNPHALKRLTTELRENFKVTDAEDGKCPIKFASPQLQSVTYLFACIDESMRLSPPVPSILPRRVGPGGMIVDGEFFSEGTDLGIPHYSMHRNEEIFPDPLVYRPERWMNDTSGTSEKNEGEEGRGLTAGIGQTLGFTPFGAGRSSCIGKHMAYQEVSYIIARLLWQFDMRMDASNPVGEGTGTGVEGRERKDEFQLFCRFVSEQQGPMLQFRRRKDM
jgi:cytochrome P450